MLFEKGETCPCNANDLPCLGNIHRDQDAVRSIFPTRAVLGTTCATRPDQSSSLSMLLRHHYKVKELNGDISPTKHSFRLAGDSPGKTEIQAMRTEKTLH